MTESSRKQTKAWKEKSIFTFSSSFKDSRVEAVLLKMARTYLGSEQAQRFERDELRLYANPFTGLTFEELSWFKLCDIAHETTRNFFSLIVIYHLLQCDDWRDGYREYLMPMFKEIEHVVKRSTAWRTGAPMKIAAVQQFFCHDDIRRLICFMNPSHDYFSCIVLQTENPHLKEALHGFYAQEESKTIMAFRTLEEKTGLVAKAFSFFIPDFRMTSTITEGTFWKQVDFVRNTYDKDSAAISYLFKFYAYLISGPMPDFLARSTLLDLQFLRNKSSIRYIRKGFHFMLPDIGMISEMKEEDKVVFIFKGYDRMYTSVEPLAYKALDCSRLLEKRYRPLFWEYALVQMLNNDIHFDHYDHLIIESLNKITEMKNQPGYDNPDPFHISRAECLAIRIDAQNRPVSATSRYKLMNVTKCFLSYCDEAGLLHFERQALRRFQNEWLNEEPGDNETLSGEELSHIFRILDEESATSVVALQVKTIARLLIDTEFRIGMICSLRTTDLIKGAKPGEWYLRSIAKTSHQKRIDHVITGETAALLLDCIEKTKGIRETMNNPMYSDSMFIYYSPLARRYYKMTRSGFQSTLRHILSKHGFTRSLSPSIFRNTHMTKALQYCIKNGRNDLEKALLTKHRKLSTTLEHYYDTNTAFREQMEDTYGIEISADLSVPGGVRDTLEETEEASVEHGCGVCSEKHCMMKSNLPCLLCGSFITTPEHEPFFEAAIKMTTETIRSADDEHLIEDLKTKKAILVMYLEKLHMYKEVRND